MNAALATCLKKDRLTKEEAKSRASPCGFSLAKLQPFLVAYRCPLGGHHHVGSRRGTKRF